MKALIISDLHLDESREGITAAFRQFIEQKVLNQGLDQFYILGDFFEVWIGDDFKSDFIESIKSDLKRIKSQVPECFFQHGNRDFLVGEDFAKETGFTLLEECHQLRLGSLSVLLMHGDSLCTLDTEYMKAREFLRSDLFIQDVLTKSIDERLVLAEQLRGASKNANSGKAMDIMDVTPSEVISCMEQHNADILIHGHTHRPTTHQINLANQKIAKRIVMSDWEAEIRYVKIQEQTIELLSFIPASA